MPKWWLPIYTMVSHTTMPYGDALPVPDPPAELRYVTDAVRPAAWVVDLSMGSAPLVNT